MNPLSTSTANLPNGPFFMSAGSSDGCGRSRTWSVRAVPAARAAEVLAYAGGVSAVIAASALTFAAMLALRRATGSLDGRS